MRTLAPRRLFESLTRLRHPTPAGLQAVAAEFLGTYVVLFIGLATATSGCHLPDSLIASDDVGDASLANATRGSCTPQVNSTLAIAFAFGFGLLVVVYITASISGGHLNPAVTVLCLLKGEVSIVRAVLYVAAQLVAAMLAALTVKGLDPHGHAAAAGMTNAVNVKRGMNPLRTWALETILTWGASSPPLFALTFTHSIATDPERRKDALHLPALAPMSVAAASLICHIVAIPLDGCSLNPARSFGPAVVARFWDTHWVFWAGPCSGAVIAFLVSELIFKRRIHAGSDVDSNEAKEMSVIKSGASSKGSRASGSAESTPAGEIGYNGCDEPYFGSVMKSKPATVKSGRRSLQLLSGLNPHRQKVHHTTGGAPPTPLEVDATEKAHPTWRAGGNRYEQWPEIAPSSPELEP